MISIVICFFLSVCAGVCKKPYVYRAFVLCIIHIPVSMRIVIVRSVCVVFMSPIMVVSLHSVYIVFSVLLVMFIVLAIRAVAIIHTVIAPNIPESIHDITFIFTPFRLKELFAIVPHWA